MRPHVPTEVALPRRMTCPAFHRVKGVDFDPRRGGRFAVRLVFLWKVIPQPRTSLSNNYQELHELDFPTSRFKASKHTKVQEQNAQYDIQNAAALDETKPEIRLCHFCSVAKRTMARSVAVRNQALALIDPRPQHSGAFRR